MFLERAFWRLLAIEALIVSYSLADRWITEQPSIQELLSYTLRFGILTTLALVFIVITLGSFLAKKIIRHMAEIAEANR
ncbi:MAG: hypothetical protein M2R45_02028 [Verrucomicrobia subdivision 3 bacterium]|nr:hypothetical protein [Limisphaerales bacterium]MCS1414847.1 hypothetical protein [Limisphaerales bacterium]